jgi:uncharacterized membrane protein/protein-disulfide isomerase
MATHFYLTNQHYDLKLGSASGPSICNISSTFNCDSVAASRYADLLGIPVALLGLITQVIFFILLISARFELSGNNALIKRTLFWLSAFTLLMSIVMGGISSFLLGTYCLFCMTAYGLSILQMLGAWKIQDSSPLAHLGEDLSHLFTESKWVLILVLLIPGLGWMVNSMMLKSAGMDKIELVIQDSLAEWEAGPTQSFQPDRGLFEGKAGAEPIMKIVEFADFLCPHCKMASTPLEAFTQAHHDVQLNFKVFALDGTCNKSIPTRGDGLRCKLGASVFCAEKLAGKGWPAHHWIFERQDEFHQTTDAKPIVEKMSHDLSLDADKVQSCMNEDSTQESLEAMAQEGAAAHIQGTPTIFVNGKILPRGQFLPVLEGLYKKLKK